MPAWVVIVDYARDVDCVEGQNVVGKDHESHYLQGMKRTHETVLLSWLFLIFYELILLLLFIEGFLTW